MREGYNIDFCDQHKENLKPRFLEELKNQSFEYAHNSYIVNFKAIIGIKNDVITLEDLTTLNISRSKRKIFHSRFADYLGGKYKRNR